MRIFGPWPTISDEVSYFSGLRVLMTRWATLDCGLLPVLAPRPLGQEQFSAVAEQRILMLLPAFLSCSQALSVWVPDGMLLSCSTAIRYLSSFPVDSVGDTI